MRSGPKGRSLTEKQASDTLRPGRDAGTVQIMAPDALPQQPDWLTEDGRQVWLDNMGRVSSVRGADEVDSELFGNFCCLQGAITKAWRVNEVPPVSALMESRKMMELLRIGGPTSRVARVSGASGAQASNPFLKRQPS